MIAVDLTMQAVPTAIPAVSCPEYRKFCMGAFLRLPVSLNVAVVCIDIAQLGNFRNLLHKLFSIT